jgi:hypothetical protein
MEMQSTGIFFSGWMEFNASRILKIEKKRNGGRKVEDLLGRKGVCSVGPG